MASSGTYIFDPDLAEIVDEAFERVRMDPAGLTARHIRSARRSMRFMLAHWATQDFHDFRIEQVSFTVEEDEPDYTDTDAPARLIDIIQVAHRADDIDTPMTQMSRQEYLDIPDKTITGRPDRYFVDKQVAGITMSLWPVPNNSTDTIVINAVRKFQDSDTASDTQDIPYQLQDAFVYGLASRLCEKYGPPEIEEKLFMKAEASLKDGSNAVRERGDVAIIPSSGRRRGGRRR